MRFSCPREYPLMQKWERGSIGWKRINIQGINFNNSFINAIKL